MRHLVVLLSLVAFADPSAWAQTKKILLNNPDPALLKELQSVTPSARVVPVTPQSIMGEIGDADALIG